MKHARPKDEATDWSRFDALTDADIEAAVRKDPDAPRVAPPDWLKRAKLIRPSPKDMISIRLDRDVLEYFRAEERWQTRINGILRTVMEHEKAGAPPPRNRAANRGSRRA
jgi:uncharacterized protein (DUF4415 family)